MNNRERLGEIGELTFKSICESVGHKVVMSSDKYDDQKDMTVNGKTVEIKTQAPWFVKRWLTFKSTQETKMRNVDLLFCIGYNHTNQKRFDWANKIWKIKKDFKIASRYKSKNGYFMFAISLDDPAVVEWCDTPAETISQCTVLSTSGFI